MGRIAAKDAGRDGWDPGERVPVGTEDDGVARAAIPFRLEGRRATTRRGRCKAGRRITAGGPISTADLEVAPSVEPVRIVVRTYLLGEHEHGPACRPVESAPGYVACAVLVNLCSGVAAWDAAILAGG